MSDGWRGWRDRRDLELAGYRLVRAGVLDETRTRSGHIKLWPKPAPVGSDAATAVEIGLEMLVRGLLAIAAWSAP